MSTAPLSHYYTLHLYCPFFWYADKFYRRLAQIQPGPTCMYHAGAQYSAKLLPWRSELTRWRSQTILSGWTSGRPEGTQYNGHGPMTLLATVSGNKSLSYRNITVPWIAGHCIKCTSFAKYQAKEILLVEDVISEDTKLVSCYFFLQIGKI
jgi:hypothetical protein